MTAWIFQGNPRLFDVDAYLSRERNVLWNANQGFKLMRAGDPVYFWRSRGDGLAYPGIIASGVLTEEPRERPPDPAAVPHWRTAADNLPARQVAIRMDVPAGQRILPAVYLAQHRDLGDLEVLRVPNATNYRVGELREASLSQEWASAALLSENDLLIESLASTVERWQADPRAQETAAQWTSAVGPARADLASLFSEFIDGGLPLANLRAEFDQRSRSPLWNPLGLAGPNGAMVLNKWTKHFPQDEMTAQLVPLLSSPETPTDGREHMRAFHSYLQAKIDAGERKPVETGITRMPAFVSAVWQALDKRNTGWPTLYTSARNALIERQVLLERDDVVQTYFEFRELILGISRRFGLPVHAAHHLLQWTETESEATAPPSGMGTSEDARPPQGRVWLMSPGEGAKNWESWKQQGIATIGWNALGDLRAYASVEDVENALKERYDATNPINNRWACFEFANTMQPGDTIFAKGGMRRVLGMGTVVGDYRHEPDRVPDHHVRSVKWTETSERNISDRKLTVKTLTNISHFTPLVSALRALYPAGSSISPLVDEAVEPAPLVSPYTMEDACRELFIDRQLVDDMLAALKTKKNLILQGPPGVGKTFVAKRLAYLLMEQKADDQLTLVQFHQSYSYEDFVQGFRPTATGGFQRENGPFYRFCEDARQDPHSPYVLVIDEINRGNVSRIFGELLMLLEADKRDQNWAVHLAYGGAEEPSFHIPANVYVIGTMNTADRSLALVDYALRRRFAFLDVPPGFDSDEFSATLKAQKVSPVVGDRIRSVVSSLNELIDKDPNLGTGYLIGHSYFCDGADTTRDDAWLERVFRMEIEPLLREYFRDSPQKLVEAQKFLARVQ